MTIDSRLEGDPIPRFLAWYELARTQVGDDADMVALATASKQGRPSARMVLYRGLSDGCPRFFTNYGSRKSHDLDENPWAALCFHWVTLQRQARIEGRVERLSAAESDAYFASRGRGSQLASAVSPQSRPIESRAWLLGEIQALERSLDGRPVPRPEGWGGYRVVPDRVELWTAGEYRIHDRYSWVKEGELWRVEMLGP